MLARRGQAPAAVSRELVHRAPNRQSHACVSRRARGGAARRALRGPVVVAGRDVGGASRQRSVSRLSESRSHGVHAFFDRLAERFSSDPVALKRATETYAANPSAASLSVLRAAVESPCQELFRRLNVAPGGTADWS